MCTVGVQVRRAERNDMLWTTHMLIPARPGVSSDREVTCTFAGQEDGKERLVATSTSVDTRLGYILTER